MGKTDCEFWLDCGSSVNCDLCKKLTKKTPEISEANLKVIEDRIHSIFSRSKENDNLRKS